MRKTYSILAVMFLLCIGILGLASDINILTFYQEGQPLNEEWTPELGRENETQYAATFFGKDKFIDANGAARRVLGQRRMNGVVRLKNGQLTELKEKKLKKKTLRREAKNVAALSKYLAKKDIPFLIVIPPDKVAKKDGTKDGNVLASASSVLPKGCSDYSNRNLDIFVDCLKETGTPYIDIREEMEKDGLDQYDYFYTTDHHWTSQAGWYAYSKIAEWTKENTDVVFDERAQSPDNYKTEDYKNCLLGTWGQRTGSLFSGSDDITLYVPKYETDVENITFQKRGTMDEAVYNREYIKEGRPDFIFDAVFDSTDQFINYSAGNNTRVMVICDSFGRVVNPFLILSAETMQFQSIYRSAEVDKALIKQTKPDIVIMLFSPWYNLGKKDSFAFGVPGVK